MATPKYNAIVAKVRDWSNKPEANTIPDSVIESCLSYSADECYRRLRIPPLESTVTYTITAADNSGEGSIGIPYGNSFTNITIPEDLTAFCYIRTVANSNGNTPYASMPPGVSTVFHEVTDKRTFFDVFSEKYSRYNWMMMDNKIFIHPQIAIDTVLEINYYRRLSPLDALYSVVPINYVIGLADADQPYLILGTSTPLYFAGSGVAEQCFATLAEATAYGLTQPINTVTTKVYDGREAPNWLRDQNERLLVWGALYNIGAYLFDDKMEQRYKQKFEENLASLNTEEKFRRASGGNVQMNFNGGGMI
jgi:hypothetical protein